MSDIVFPFVQDFLEEKRETLYVFSDSHVRLRDPLAILCLSHFFAAHGPHCLPRRGMTIFAFLLERQRILYPDHPVNPVWFSVLLGDLDQDIRSVFNDVYKEVREQRPQPDTLQLFEFEVENPPFSPTVQDLFEEAALILSFVAANDKGNVYIRAPVKGYKHIWSKLQKEQAKSKSKHKELTPGDTEEYSIRWFNLVERAIQSL